MTQSRRFSPEIAIILKGGCNLLTRYEKVKSLSLQDMASFLSQLQWDSNEPTTQEMYQWLSELYFSDEEDVLYVATDGLRKQLVETER